MAGLARAPSRDALREPVRAASGSGRGLRGGADERCWPRPPTYRADDGGRRPWRVESMRSSATSRSPTSPVVRLVLAVQSEQLRDAAWSLMTRANAADHFAFWTAAMRATPDDLLAPVGSSGCVRRVAVRPRRAGVACRRTGAAGRSRLLRWRWACSSCARPASTRRSGTGRTGAPRARTGEWRRALEPGQAAVRRSTAGWWRRGCRHRRTTSREEDRRWAKRSSAGSSRARTGAATARRSGTAWTSSPGCCASRASTSTGR